MSAPAVQSNRKIQYDINGRKIFSASNQRAASKNVNLSTSQRATSAPQQNTLYDINGRRKQDSSIRHPLRAAASASKINRSPDLRYMSRRVAEIEKIGMLNC